MEGGRQTVCNMSEPRHPHEKCYNKRVFEGRCLLAYALVVSTQVRLDPLNSMKSLHRRLHCEKHSLLQYSFPAWRSGRVA